MPHHSQAEIFMKTLAEMRDEECERQAARLRLRHKAQANRFMKAFWAEVDDLHPSELPMQSAPEDLETTPPSRSG